jgi:hypothetical protein
MNAGKIGGFALVMGMAIAWAAPARAQEMAVRYKFREGEIQKYRWSIKVSIALADAKRSLADYSVFWSQRVRKVEGDAAVVEVLFTRVAGKSFEMSTLEEKPFDSEKDDSSGNLLLSYYSKILGRPLSVRMDSRGNYSEVPKAQGEGEAPPGLGEARKLLNPLSRHFPEEAVKVGSAWKEESTFNLQEFGDLVSTATDTLEAFEGDRVKVRYEGLVGAPRPEGEPGKGEDASGKKGERPGMAAFIQGGKRSGRFEFDSARGLLLKDVSATALTIVQFGEAPLEVEGRLELLAASIEGEEPEDRKDK